MEEATPGSVGVSGEMRCKEVTSPGVAEMEADCKMHEGGRVGERLWGGPASESFFFSLLLLFGSKTADAGTEVNVYRE